MVTFEVILGIFTVTDLLKILIFKVKIIFDPPLTYKSEVLFPLHQPEFFIGEIMRILFSIFALVTQQFSIVHQGNHAKENIKTGMNITS